MQYTHGSVYATPPELPKRLENCFGYTVMIILAVCASAKAPLHGHLGVPISLHCNSLIVSSAYVAMLAAGNACWRERACVSTQLREIAAVAAGAES